MGFRFKILVFHLFSVFIFVNCSDISLGPIEDIDKNQASEGIFKIDPPVEKDSFTKFLFVVDKSGSNNNTDPGADRRYNSILNYYQDNKTEEFLKWGLMVFVGGDPEVYIQNPYFSQDEAQVTEGIERLKERDNGNTPYGSSLAMTRSIIRQDMEDFPDEESNYMVIFLSDGVPTDITDVPSLRGLVQDIVSLDPGKIFLSTGYYSAGSSDGIAIDRLREMADAGGGKFFNFRDQDDLDFDQLIVQPTKEPWQLKNNLLMVYNLNSTTCIFGGIGVDSDSDGLCDKDELNLGLDPQKRFSFDTITDEEGNVIDVSGYGDYFHWRRIEFGESLPPCSDRSDEDHDFLTACEEAYIVNNRPTTVFPDGTPRYRGDPKNPDTDLDGYLDGIEIFMFKDKGSANDILNVLNSYDGEADNAGNQIRQHRDPNAWDPDAFRYNVRINRIALENGSSVYKYSQSRLQLFDAYSLNDDNALHGYGHKTDENNILVYYIQVPHSDKDGPGIMKYSVQTLKADQRNSSSKGTAAGVKVACEGPNDPDCTCEEKGNGTIQCSLFQEYVVPQEL